MGLEKKRGVLNEFTTKSNSLNTESISLLMLLDLTKDSAHLKVEFAVVTEEMDLPREKFFLL